MAAAVDTYKGFWRGMTAPAQRVAVVTPDDANDLPAVTRFVSLAVAGAVKVTTRGGDTVVIPSGALMAGVQHRLEVTRVWATGTTATGIVAYW
jgi:hypothetical protein